MDKYYVEEISVNKEGVSAHAINEKPDKNKALSDFHLVMAYALLNENLVSMHAEVKNAFGGVIKRDTWVAETPAEDTEENEE